MKLFIFESCFYNLVSEPYGWEIGPDSYLEMTEDDADWATDEEIAQFQESVRTDGDVERPYITVKEFYDREDCVNSEHVFKEWTAEHIWASRDEAEEYGRQKSRYYEGGWRVREISSMGGLSKL